ncbi:MAG: S8 family serine peptidase [Planctomycetota bacterium]
MHLRLLTAVLFLNVSLHAAPQLPDLFTEIPGVQELSGQMIVRRQPDLAATERYQAAADRLDDLLIEYLPETDEHLIRVPAGESESTLAAELLATGDYEYVVPDWRVFPVDTVPNDPEYWRLWHHPKMRSPLAWDITTGSSDVTIAFVDSGVEKAHPDLAASLVPGYNAKDQLPESAGGLVDDLGGHGTFVTGCAAAIGNNQKAVVGVGWRFRIMPIRYSNDPCGCGVLSDVLRGARWAATNGADCVSVSQTGVTSPTVQTTGAFVRAQGALFFYAADNSGTNHAGFDWPDVIVVGATDQNDARPSWSSYGTGVDLFAPGNEILSTGMPGGIAIGSGTSAATPMAAGLAGLVWSVAPWLSPAEVEQYLNRGCVDLGLPGEDDEFGHGRIDSFESVRLARDENTLGYDQAPLFKGQSSTATVTRANPGQTVYWLLSLTGEGEGPCVSGRCLDILSPQVVIGLPADAQGVATWTFTVPNVVPIVVPVWLQAITLDPIEGMITSNVEIEVVQ